MYFCVYRCQSWTLIWIFPRILSTGYLLSTHHQTRAPDGPQQNVINISNMLLWQRSAEKLQIILLWRSSVHRCIRKLCLKSFLLHSIIYPSWCLICYQHYISLKETPCDMGHYFVFCLSHTNSPKTRQIECPMTSAAETRVGGGAQSDATKATQTVTLWPGHGIWRIRSHANNN